MLLGFWENVLVILTGSKVDLECAYFCYSFAMAIIK